MHTSKPTTLDWEGSGLPEAPVLPTRSRKRVLPSASSTIWCCAALYIRGAMLGLDLAKLMCLPFKVIEEALRFLKDEKCIEVAGGD